MIGREIAIAKRSICVLIVGFVVIGFATEAWVLYAGLVPFAYAAASVVPCLSSAVSNYGGISEKGTDKYFFKSYLDFQRSELTLDFSKIPCLNFE